MNRFRHRKFLASTFGLLTILFLVLAMFAFVLLKDHQDNLRQHTYDETGLAALQIRLHYETLMGKLAIMQGYQSDTALEDAVLQFDILYERLTALPTRPTYKFLLNEETLAIQADIQKVLTTLVPRIDRAAQGDAKALDGMRTKLILLRPLIERLAHHPVQMASERRSAHTASFENISDWFSWIIIGFVMSGLAFAAIIWQQMSLAARRRNELEGLTESLREARDAAEAGSRAKSDFLSHMSHELRTPMNSILGFAQIIEMRAQDSAQVSAAEQILRSGHLLMHLIDQILELNKVIAGGIQLSLGNVVPADLVDDCFALMSVTSAEKGLTMTQQAPQDPISVLNTDAYRLKQILVNLLSNAIKYNHDGGQVTLSWVCAPKDRVRFSVIDTGAGIPPGSESEIFQPFNRLGRESLNIEGTGIGLTITHELVKMLGGELQYESILGEGSTFWFEIPLKSP